MKISNFQLIMIGIICVLIGINLIVISWILSYPINFSDIDTPIFYQFFPSIWPGITVSLIGLFIIGYQSNKKIVKYACIASLPLIYYSFIYFFTYAPTSDSGNVRAMFEMFHKFGPNSNIEAYFQYPTYFNINEITHLILGIDVNFISLLFFALYGVLISMFIFIYLSQSKNKNPYQLAFFCIFFYFIGVFSFINYQWVPQTLALVFFFSLLFLFEKDRLRYKIIATMIFAILAFSHAFIPVMFLIFFGFYSLKNRKQFDLFILFSWIYSMILLYHTTAYLPDIIETFQDTIIGVGEYQNFVSRSLKETIGLTSQIISYVNRMLVPLIWITVMSSFTLLFFKRKLRVDKIILGITGGLYLIAGFFFSILGTRALQIFLIPLVSSVEYYIKNWEKYFVIFVFLIILFCVFLPVRSSYDNYFFQKDEEKQACNFLAYKIPTDRYNQVGVSQISGDYFFKKMIYFNWGKTNVSYPFISRPHSDAFYNIFNYSMYEGQYLIFNQNLGKHISAYGLDFDIIFNIIDQNFNNNKIYDAGNTYIMAGL